MFSCKWLQHNPKEVADLTVAIHGKIPVGAAAVFRSRCAAVKNHLKACRVRREVPQSFGGAFRTGSTRLLSTRNGQHLFCLARKRNRCEGRQKGPCALHVSEFALTKGSEPWSGYILVSGRRRQVAQRSRGETCVVGVLVTAFVSL